jgi:uncharacterized integral membrane protein
MLTKLEFGLAAQKSNLQKLELWHTWLTSFRMILIMLTDDLSNVANLNLRYLQALFPLPLININLVAV